MTTTTSKSNSEEYYLINKTFVKYGKTWVAGDVFRKSAFGMTTEKGFEKDPDKLLKGYLEEDVRVRKEMYKDAIGTISFGGKMPIDDKYLKQESIKRSTQVPIPTDIVKRIVPISKEEFDARHTLSNQHQIDRIQEQQLFV